jgi:hypothetical protein
MSWTEPRSTRSHWGSEAWLDQRVPVLPSKADAAGVPAFSVEDAVAGLPWAALAVEQAAAPSCESGAWAATAGSWAGRVISAAVVASANPRDLSRRR